MDSYISMSKFGIPFKSKKQRIIALIIVIILVLAGAGAAVYFGYILPSMKTAGTGADAPTKAGTGYKTKLKTTTDKIDTLVKSGDSKSIEQAGQIADKEVVTANESGNDAYIVDASLAKATLLINTNRAQEAIDSILIPLDQKYGTNETYRYNIYGFFNWAYRVLGNTAKADEYYAKIPVKGWN